MPITGYAQYAHIDDGERSCISLTHQYDDDITVRQYDEVLPEGDFDYASRKNEYNNVTLTQYPVTNYMADCYSHDGGSGGAGDLWMALCFPCNQHMLRTANSEALLKSV